MNKKITAIITSAISTISATSLFAMNAFAEESGASADSTAAAAGTGGGMITTLVIPLVLMFVILYFMAIRPQKKREQEAKEMQDSLQVGDEIITSGGIVGMVVRIGDDTIVMETGGERHKLRIKKWAIGENVTASERAKAAASKTKTKLAAAGVSDSAAEEKPKKSKKKKDEDE